MALPFTGPCGVGLGLFLEGNPCKASPLAKPVADGDSILVIFATSFFGAVTHTAPIDNAGNLYNLIGTFVHTGGGRISAYLARNIVGHARLAVEASASVPADHGIVVIPLYGDHTYNGDFATATGTSATPSVSTTTTPAGSIGFGCITGNAVPNLFMAATPGQRRIYHSEQFDQANGQNVYANFLEASGPFTASWTIAGGSSFGAIAFSLSGPTVPALPAPSGVEVNYFSRTNTTHANDDGSDFDAYTSAYGFAGWMSDSLDVNAEQRGTHPWSVRSRFRTFYLDLYLKDAGGALCTRTYTWRKNGIDDLLSITVSIVSSGDGTYVQGSDLVHFVDYEPGDKITLHRTGSGGSPEFDITHWSVDCLNEGNRVSACAMINCATNNGAVTWGAPMTWKGSPVNDGFRQFRDDSSLNARSLMAFNGRVTRYDIGFWLQSNLRTANYPFVWNKSIAPQSLTGVTQDGTGGTPDTQLSLTGADLDVWADIDLPFLIGDWLQLQQGAPSGTAFNTLFSLSVAIESEVDGEYGLSIDWAGFLGGNLGATHNYAGVNKATGTHEPSTTAERMGPVTFGRMNVRQLLGSGPPGVGNHLFYRLLHNGDVSLDIDLTGSNEYGVVEGSVPYVQGDFMDWVFLGSGSPPDRTFMMGLAMSGPIVGAPVRLTQLPIEIAYDFGAVRPFQTNAARAVWETPPPILEE